MKKFFTSALALTMALSTAISFTSCSTEPSPELMAFNEALTATEIIERINNMGEATMENEAIIEEIFVDYTRLDDSEKEKVTNYGTLDDARNAITKLYHTEEKDGPRFDRSKIQIGTYCLYNTSEERIQWLSEAGIDFVAGAPYNMDVLDLFSKYDIGAFISYLPGWYGDDGSNGGTLSEQRPSGIYNSYAESFVDHPAIWAVDVGDEPSALDFPHYGILINEAKELFPNQLVYLNLYPIYASEDQQGTITYEEYIQIYADNVDTDYISFDFYDIDKKAERKKEGSDFFMLRHVENLRIVANACREKGIDMWTVMQAGTYSDEAGDYITVAQLNAQLYTSLAFGSQVINWACWESGWFDANSNMIDSAGNRTPAYYNVQEVNANIKALSPVYMRYINTDTAFVGNRDAVRQRNTMDRTDDLNFIKNDGNVLDQDMFQDIEVVCDGAVILAGSFVKRGGNGEAILFSNVTNFYGREDIFLNSDVNTETVITFTLKDADRKVIIYYPEVSYVMEPDADGTYRFSLENTDGVFITAEPIAAETVE